MSWSPNTLVTMLLGSDFDNAEPWNLRSDKRCSFVLFFAEWCGHCQNFKPEYEKFADRAQFIHVYAVDIDAEKNLLTRINKNPNSPITVTSYPTLLIYRDGKPHKKYSGERTWQALLTEAMRVCNTDCECC